jgi:membrane-associated phospholipid phosphatase
MKKLPWLAFPALFALATLGLFLFFYPPRPGSPELTSACLVFLTALGWSALIALGERGLDRAKAAIAAAALLASALVAGLRPFAVEPRAHWTMVILQALGGAGIILYLRILKNKGE